MKYTEISFQSKHTHTQKLSKGFFVNRNCKLWHKQKGRCYSTPFDAIASPRQMAFTLIKHIFRSTVRSTCIGFLHGWLKYYLITSFLHNFNISFNNSKCILLFLNDLEIHCVQNMLKNKHHANFIVWKCYCFHLE